MKRLLILLFMLALTVPLVAQSTYTDETTGLSFVMPADWSPVPVDGGVIAVSADQSAAVWFQWFDATAGTTDATCLQLVIDTYVTSLTNVTNISFDPESPNVATLSYENENGVAVLTCNVYEGDRILGIMFASDVATYDTNFPIMMDIFDSTSLGGGTTTAAVPQGGNISVTLEAGWSISDSAADYLLVTDDSGSGALLYFNFAPQDAGMTPESCLDDLLTMLEGVGLSQISVTSSDRLDATTAYIEFSHSQDTATGMASCNLSNGEYYVRFISIPNTLFNAYLTPMMTMLGSVQFPTAQPVTQAQPQPQTANVDDPFAILGGIAPVGNVQQLPQGQATVQVAPPPVPVNISYTTWIDPLENAFAVEVPANWVVDGGTYDVFGTKLPFYSMLSPDEEILIFVGQAEMLLSLQPSPAWSQAGYSEGSNIYADNSFYVRVASYKTGAQAAQEIVEANIAPLCQQFAITDVRDLPESSGLLPDQSAYVSSGEAAYTCVLEGELAVGYQYAATYAAIDPTYGEVWTIQDVLGFIAADGREDEAVVAMAHSMETFTLNEQWVQAYQQQQQQMIQQAQAQMDDASYYAMLSDISAMEHETTMSILGNIGGDVTWEWEWEYDYGW